MKWIFLIALVVFVAWWYEQQKAAVSQAMGGSYGLPTTYGGARGTGATGGAYNSRTTPLYLNNASGLGGVSAPSGIWLNSFGTHLDYSIPGQFQAATGGTFGDDAAQIGGDPWNMGVGCRGSDGIAHCVILKSVY